MMKLLLLFTLLSLLHISAGDPRLVCQETVVTRIGDNVLLPCHLEPQEIIEHEMVEVTKVDPDALVYFYHNGKQLGDYYESYKHRTFLNTEELKRGILNLKISSVRQSDNGTFRIYIHKWRINFTVNLAVGNPCLVCQETVVARIGYNGVLRCYLEPKQSIEDDKVEVTRENAGVLVYACHNKKQSPDQADQYKHRTFLNFEDLKSGVLNLKISSVTQSDKGTYKIYIRKWGIMSTINLVVGVVPSDDPPVGVFFGVAAGAVTLIVILGVVVWILVKHKVIQTCWSRMMMMMMRAQMRQHGDEDPRSPGGNGHLDPEKPVERESML